MLIALWELTVQERKQDMYEWKAEHDRCPGGSVAWGRKEGEMIHPTGEGS